MPKVVFLLISKLDGPPSSFLPRNAAENRGLPLKSYVFANYSLADVYHSVIANQRIIITEPLNQDPKARHAHEQGIPYTHLFGD